MLKLEQIVILFFILLIFSFLFFISVGEYGYIKGQYDLLIEDNKIFEHKINDSMEVIKILRDENFKLKERYYDCNTQLELCSYYLSDCNNRNKEYD